MTLSQIPGLLASDTAGSARLYLRNTLYSYIDWSIVPMSRYDGKGKDIDEMYDIITQDTDPELKQRIRFQGKEGFMTCRMDYSNGYSISIDQL